MAWIEGEDKKSERSIKYDEGKNAYDCMPWDALDAIAQVFTYGKNKYGAHNWERSIIDPGPEFTDRLFAAAIRHLSAYAQHSYIDEESKLPALAHAGADVLMLLAYYLRKPGFID